MEKEKLKAALRKLISEQYEDLHEIKSLPDSLLEKIARAALLLSPSDDKEAVLRTADILLDDVYDSFSEPEAWRISFPENGTACVQIHKDLPSVSVFYKVENRFGISILKITSANPGCKKLIEIYSDTVWKIIQEAIFKKEINS